MFIPEMHWSIRRTLKPNFILVWIRSRSKKYFNLANLRRFLVNFKTCRVCCITCILFKIFLQSSNSWNDDNCTIVNKTSGGCWRVLFFSFSSHSRIFHSYGDVIITVEGLQIWTYARHSWPLSSEGSLACHIYCGTEHPFLNDTHICCRAFCSWAFSTVFTT